MISSPFKSILLCQNKVASTLADDDADNVGSCVVTEKAGGERKPCRFPFVFNRKEYNGCTDEGGSEGEQKWCSTK